MFRACRTVAVVLTTAAFLLPSHAAGQSDQPGVFGEILDVRVVNVEVVVTDRQGNRVWGLGPEDFELFVDGEPQPIDYFTEVRGGVAADREDVQAAPVPGVDQGKELGTSYLVFVDNYFGVARDRNQVLDALEKQVAGLGPEDRMAIVSFDGRRLQMLTSWERNPAALERALDRARRQPANGLQRLAEARLGADADLRTLGRFDRGPIGRQELGIDQEYYARQLQEQLDRSVTDSAATLRAFASPPGPTSSGPSRTPRTSWATRSIRSMCPGSAPTPPRPASSGPGTSPRARSIRGSSRPTTRWSTWQRGPAARPC